MVLIRNRIGDAAANFDGLCERPATVENIGGDVDGRCASVAADSIGSAACVIVWMFHLLGLCLFHASVMAALGSGLDVEALALDTNVCNVIMLMVSVLAVVIKEIGVSVCCPAECASPASDEIG